MEKWLSHNLFLIKFSSFQETERLLAEPVEGVNATPYEDNVRYFNVAIAGPSDSPYQGFISGKLVEAGFDL